MNSWEQIILRMPCDQKRRFELDIMRLVEMHKHQISAGTASPGIREGIHDLEEMLDFLESLKRIDESDMISENPAELGELLSRFGVMEVVA